MALDALASSGHRFANIADIGTGTGLLAFAALKLWPQAKCIATHVDGQAIDVARDNAAINGVPLGHGAGELLLAVADGMESPLLAARAPFDLIVANILARPLIELAPAFADLGAAVARMHGLDFPAFGELDAAGGVIDGLSDYASALARRAARHGLGITPLSNPMVMPVRAQAMPPRRTRRMTWPRSAPIAMRTPISCVRWATEYESTP